MSPPHPVTSQLCEAMGDTGDTCHPSDVEGWSLGRGGKDMDHPWVLLAVCALPNDFLCQKSPKKQKEILQNILFSKMTLQKARDMKGICFQISFLPLGTGK